MSEPRTSAEKLTPREFSTMLMLQGAHCARCDNTGPYEADHSTPLAFERGQKPDQLLCKTCHDLKTNGPRHLNIGDKSKVASAKRHRDGKTQFDKRKAAGGTRIKSPGFRKDVKKRMNGEVEKRNG